MDPIRQPFEDARATLDAFLADASCLAGMHAFVKLAGDTLRAGGTLLSCGNGGSMCDAMHFAEEWTGRFRKDRRALPAIAFSDPSQLTCMANDFGFEEVFARSVEAYGRPGDLLVAITTSGGSPNILKALEKARSKGLKTVGLLGKGGGKAKDLCDVSIVVPLATTSDRIQEIHIKVIHITIEAVERELFPANYAAT